MNYFFDPSELIKKVDLDSGLEERCFNLSSYAHLRAVERICALYQAIKTDQPKAKDPYQPGGEWLNYIEEKKALYTPLLLGSTDQVSEMIGNFWRNDFGAIVKEYANFKQLRDNEAGCVERFLYSVCKNYLIWKDIFRQEDRTLEIPKVGNPWGVYLNQILVAPKATRFHSHSFIIRELLSDLPDQVVAEIGAGYCGVAYYLLRDNPRLTYIEFDLPETLIIAAYYLLVCYPDEPMFLYGEGDVPSQEEFKNYRAILLPNFSLESFPKNSVDLFLNSFSLSEMPRYTLDVYLKIISLATRRFFLHNNMDRKGVINRGFERIPASDYPIDSELFKCLYKTFDLFHGHLGDYREFLYEKKCQLSLG